MEYYNPIKTLNINLLARHFPHRLTDIESWHGHIPFAFCLTTLLKPKRFVELGVHKGDSYCAFCQAMQSLDEAGVCFGVDTWGGDPQAGRYGPEVFEELKAYHDSRYGKFSTLLQLRFDDALSRFEDGGIDLLHIDGLHTYEAVRHDFESWLPKMSDRGVVLLHDTQVFGAGFGVWKFWEEIRDAHPHFDFHHSNGLGVLGVGRDLPTALSPFFDADPIERIRLRHLFAGMGERIGKTSEPPAEDDDFQKALCTETAGFNPDSPKISVVVPAYNHERFIREALYSVLAQTVTDFELIVVNDGATDATEAAVLSVRDPRIRYVAQVNQGAHAAINRGVGMAKAEFVCILNSDDAYEPKRLETLLGEMTGDTSLAAVFSQVTCVDGDGKPIRTVLGPEENWPNKTLPEFLKQTDAMLPRLLSGNFLLSTSNLFCRKSAFEELGGFAPYRYVHDWDFFLRMADAFPTRLVARPLLRYRIHAANTLKEGEAAVKEESARMLLSFLLDCDLVRHLPADGTEAAMAALLTALGPCDLDRAMLVPLLFAAKNRIDPENLVEHLNKVGESSLKTAARDYFQEYANAWRQGQEAWEQWEEANRRSIETEKRLRTEMDQKLASAHGETDKWWRESQTAWKKWEETNLRLTEMDAKLTDALAESNRWWQESQTAWKQWETVQQERNTLAARRAELEVRCAELEARLNALMQSHAYRLGNRMLAPARAVRSMIAKKEPLS